MISLASRQRNTCLGSPPQVAPADLTSTDAAVWMTSHPHHAATSSARPRWNATTITNADRSQPLPMSPSARPLEMPKSDTSNAERTVAMAAVRKRRLTGRAPRRRNTCSAPEDPCGSPKVRFNYPIDAVKMESALRSTKRHSLKLHPKLSAWCCHRADALTG
jgi:hypothetical protein